MNVRVTDTARGELLEAGLKDGGVLRLSVRPGGCSGMQYQAEIAESVTADETIVYDAGGVRIAASTRDAEYLDGLTIDFSTDLVRPGFILSNPKAKGSCGCGSSFGGQKGGCGG